MSDQQGASFSHAIEAADLLSRPIPDAAHLRPLANLPDPPAHLVCDVCRRTLRKSSETLGAECCGRPMREEQREKAVDWDVLTRALKGGV